LAVVGRRDLKRMMVVAVVAAATVSDGCESEKTKGRLRRVV
jgi:hypothetical protein